MSLIVNCETQAEIDHYWYKLSEGGKESYCGWLKDKFAISWQIVATGWIEMLNNPDKEKTKRVTEAIFQMRKPELTILERAFNGK